MPLPMHACRSYQVPLGLAAAVSTRVGNSLGAGDGKAARYAAMTGMGLALAVQATLATSVVCLAAKPLVCVCLRPGECAMAAA